MPNRADLADCVPTWPCRNIRVRVHRNHGFEPVATAAPAYAAWNGLAYDFAIGGYDDSLSFDLAGEREDVEVVWLDTDRLRGLGAELWPWLVSRFQSLRSLTSNPIFALVWPLEGVDRAILEQACIPALHIPDLAALADAMGNGWLDRRAEALSGTRLSNRACLAVARELACRWLPASICQPMKAVAVDLDGTLYASVLGEDGPEGVVLTEGHRALQARLAALKDDGVFLALVSRNELSDVSELFARRRDFPLALEDFSVVEVSWGDKAAALERVAAQLRIGLDSVVFVDDNPGELAAVASQLPVFTVHARDDGRETVAAVDHVAGLFRWTRTAEDGLRADDLRANAERDSIAQSVASPEDYLRSLDVRLEYFVGAEGHVPRVAELVQKTNQFNLSLARMKEAEIARRLEQGTANVIAIRLADRLSDSGIVGAVIGSRDGDTLRVEEICVSCRALGRRIEDTMLTRALTLMAGDIAPSHVVFDVAQGPRNRPAREWLASYLQRSLSDEARSIDAAFADIANRPLSPAISVEIVP